MESILNYIERNIERNGKLNQHFTLDSYRKKKSSSLNFADGAEDGIMLFHMKEQPDSKVTNHIIELIKETNDKNIEEICIKIDDFYENNEIKTLPNMDSIINEIRANVSQINVNAMLNLSIRIIVNTCNIEMMKLGISILGMADISDNKQLVEVIEKLALSDEFTLYANFAIEMWDNANEIRFMLAKKVDGWGKIHLVSSLKPLNDNIKEWLITEGCENNVHLGYLAYILADKVDLIDVLHREKLNKKQLEGIGKIMKGLIEEGPIGGFEDFEDSTELFESYLEQFKYVMDDINFYNILILIAKYLFNKENNSEEEKYIIIKIGKIIESENTKNTLRNAILSENIENLRKAIEVVAIDENIELSEEIYNVFSKNPFNNYYAFEYLLNLEKYRNKSIYLMENSKRFIQYYEEPQPIVWANNDYYTNLTYIIETLRKYPFACSNIIAAGLMSKVMQPRNMALNTIESWIKISKKDIKEFPDIILEALNKLQKTEIVKSYKERINILLGINEDLSKYEEPQILMIDKEEELDIDLFSSKVEELFETQIKFRGKDYFENNMIHSCIQKENKYLAYVQGTDFGKEYEVEIEMDGTMIRNMKCNCPYTRNCKHEYALILWLKKKGNYEQYNI